MSMIIRVEVTGVNRTGISAKNQKPWCMFEGYCHLPNVPYPQKATFYAELPSQVPQPGMYECDVVIDVRDGRLDFQVDPRQGRRMQKAADSAPQKVA